MAWKKTQILLDSIPLFFSYALFGPNDEVKQALLECILGLWQPYKGEVRVLGKIPGTQGAAVPGSGVGYMRSALSLPPNLLVRDTLLCFGDLHGMPRPLLERESSFRCPHTLLRVQSLRLPGGHLLNILIRVVRSTERFNALKRMLKLPDGGFEVGSLYADEQALVSFAVALIHSPPLLVLEEPLHGLDSLQKKMSVSLVSHKLSTFFERAYSNLA